MSALALALGALAHLVPAPHTAPIQEPVAPAEPQEEQVARTAPRALVDLLPSETLYYLHLPDWASWRESLESTRLMALLRDDEVADFLAPVLGEISAGIESMMEEASEKEDLSEEDAEMLSRVRELRPGAIDLALLRVEVPRMELEELFDGPDVRPYLVVSLELEDAEEIFDWLGAKLLEDDDGPELVDIAGRRGYRDLEDSLALVLDGGRFVLGYGTGVLEELFAREGDGLGASASFRQLHEEINGGTDGPFAYLDAQRMVELYGHFLSATVGTLDEEAGEALVRMSAETPILATLRHAGWSLRPEGEDLVERIWVQISDPEPWGFAGPLGDTAARHARLAPPGAEIFWSSSVDLADQVTRARAERDRMLDIIEDMDEDSEVLEAAQEAMASNNLAGMIEALREETGVDLETELFPALGRGLSVAVDLPAAAMLAMPDVVLAIDVVDREQAEAALERLVTAASDTPLVEVSSQRVDGRLVLRVELPGTGLPFLPTVALLEEQLLVALSPATITARIAALEGEAHLAGSGRFDLAPSAPEDATVTGAVWVDLGGLYGWAQGLSGFVLAMLRQSGVETGDRLDPAMLPTPETMNELLGVGTMLVVVRPGGMLLESRSTLGNPMTGPFLALSAVAGMYGAAMGFEEGLAEEHLRGSRRNMEALAEALEVYRTTAGGGAYPTELTALIDRGLLTDPELLVDPADPRPRRLRTGDGERVPVSYVLAPTSRMPIDGHEGHVLHTRAAWHETAQGAVYLVLPLGESEHRRVHEVPQEHWE